MNCILRGVRVIDPAVGTDLAGQDVWLSDGRIIAIYRQIDEGTVPVVDLTPGPGLPPCILAPGFIDLHAHLREPGDEDAETVVSGGSAAAAGGYTRVVAMANTSPPVDTPARVAAAVSRAAAAPVEVQTVAAVSSGLRGTELVDVGGCVDAGAVALSDDGRNAAPGSLLTEALRRADDAGVPVLVHPEDEAAIAAASSACTSVPRIADRPAHTETAAVETALAALRSAGRGRLHLQHVSTAAAVDVLRRARREGLRVTAEVTPHHLAMWLPVATAVEPALLRVNPPLRSEADRCALVQALRDGVIDAVATDHAPHTRAAKDGEGHGPAPGMVGLETALAVCLTLGGMGGDWTPTLLERLTTGPHRVLGSGRAPRLSVGEAATCVLVDPSAEWTVGASPFLSRSRNTPLLGVRLRGRVLLTMRDGTVVHRDPAAMRRASLMEATSG